MNATTTATTLRAVQEAGEDFEWYPTTQRMIDVVAKAIKGGGSVMDIGAGDGRVLTALSKGRGERGDEYERTLYAIEKSAVLVQAQPENVIPVGTDLFEQNLACLPVDYIFSNPPYSQYEAWATTIIESGYAKRAFLVIPRRWKDSDAIARSLKKRGAKAKIIHSDDFHDAERRARAVVDIVEVSYPRGDDYYGRNEGKPKDPFDIWFDQNIDTFDREEEVKEEESDEKNLARYRNLTTIAELVEEFNEEYGRMEANYRAIFKLDYAILKELGVEKEGVREGIKKKMAGLKTKFWQLLFERLDTITNRLSTATKRSFLERLTGQATVAFTSSNAYAIVLWAIKHANKYYDRQLVQLFKDLSTFEGVMNYKSNQRTWGRDDWRFSHYDRKPEPTHYTLDYRIVVCRHGAIPSADRNGYVSTFDSPGGLHNNCHELIDDMTAVFYNLGFPLIYGSTPTRSRCWAANSWQDFREPDRSTLFQVKAFMNGNVHLRMKPEAIKALNVEAGRLMGWLRSANDVVAELGYTPEEAQQYFGSHRLLTPASVKLLAGPASQVA